MTSELESSFDLMISTISSGPPPDFINLEMIFDDWAAFLMNILRSTRVNSWLLWLIFNIILIYHRKSCLFSIHHGIFLCQVLLEVKKICIKNSNCTFLCSLPSTSSLDFRFLLDSSSSSITRFIFNSKKYINKNT